VGVAGFGGNQPGLGFKQPAKLRITITAAWAHASWIEGQTQQKQGQ
jgi:hypothetical protein